ncbi:MAG: sugar kinase [Clostridiales bacterium]|nr:sugar kinase [Clostridiales bacterium]
MKHENSILKNQLDPTRLITIGEIMLRLTPPNYYKVRMTNSFDVSYGGSEANIALSLANLGIDSTFFSVVPNNSLGKSAIRWLRSNDVHCTPIILSTPEETPTHRLGSYFYESGYGIRSGKVTYDRKHSAITEYDYSKVNLKALLKPFTWLHLSGITPALDKSCADFIFNCLKTANELGLTVSFDGNFRAALWTWEEARDFCTKCLPYINVLFGIEPYHLYKDPDDYSKGDWKDDIPFQPNLEEQDLIFKKFIEAYPNIEVIARHVRYVHSGSENSLMAYMWYNGQTYESNLLRFNILDRVGGGDAFASGMMYGLIKKFSPPDIVNFGVALSAIKHTLHGDGNITDDLDDVKQLMNMNFEIKR